MEAFLHNPTNLWLSAGVLLIVFEAITSPGLGLFLAGLGAICTAILIKAGFVEEAATGAQFAWFFGFTTAWAALLWKPLQTFRLKSRRHSTIELNNMVGETAIVAEAGLQPGRPGQVTWSGTLMTAELDPSVSINLLPAGTQVRIKSIAGNTLRVVPK